MTEAAWLACGDPARMLALIRGKIGDRKLRLFACACCRRIVPLLTDPALLRTLEVTELFAERLASAEECRTASERVFAHYSAAVTQERGSNADLALGWAAALTPAGAYPV